MRTEILRDPNWTPDDDWLFVESRALKKKLSGVRVTAANYREGREVPVGFVNPDFEIRRATYPGIYITYGDITRASGREHRGPANLPYAPSGWPVDVDVPDGKGGLVSWEDTGRDPALSPYRMQETPIPYDMEFRIAVLTRNYQQAFEIAAQLSSEDYLHDRWGYLEVPEDGTIRTLELVNGPDISVLTDEDGKRLVQTLYSVVVTAELNTELVGKTAITVHRVDDVDVQIVPMDQPLDL